MICNPYASTPFRCGVPCAIRGLVLCLLAALAGGSYETKAFAETPEAHPMTEAIALHANLQLLTTLGLNRQQLLDVLNTARTAQQAVNNYQNTLAQLGQAKSDLFRQQAQLLAQGQPVPEEIQKGITDYFAACEEARLKLWAAIDEQIQALRRRALTPEQARLIAWTPPPEVTAAADEQALLSDLRELHGSASETLRALEQLRYLNPVEFITTRIGRLREFLRQYYEPNTPEFEAAMDFMLQLTDEMRRVREQDWPAEAPLFVGRVLLRLGLWNGPQGGGQAGPPPPYNWWDLFYLLTNEHTPELIQQLLMARGGAAP